MHTIFIVIAIVILPTWNTLELVVRWRCNTLVIKSVAQFTSCQLPVRMVYYYYCTVKRQAKMAAVTHEKYRNWHISGTT